MLIPENLAINLVSPYMYAWAYTLFFCVYKGKQIYVYTKFSFKTANGIMVSPNQSVLIT